MTQRIPLNRGWEFTEHYTDAFSAGAGGTDIETVELPHTTRVVPYSYFDESLYEMDCGYRRRLDVPESWAGKRVFLHIGAAGHRAEVFVNGKRLAEHRCGYTAFRVELTEELSPGAEALLSVRVDSRESLDQPPFGFVIDYMTFGGLYREVWLEVRDRRFIDDVFARPRFGGQLDSTVTLAGDTEGLRLRQRVLSLPDGALVAEHVSEAEGERTEISFRCPGALPWSVEQPRLYTLVTELLLAGGAVVDRCKTVIGFRKAEWRADGLWLNGRKVKLVGLNRHQSYPYAGYAVPASLQRHDADILKRELGLNAVRTSHYPQSQHFLDRCDELGLLVFTEIPGWQHIGGEEWKEQALENVRDMVTQYRNHPSVILWGVRINESQDDDALYTRTNVLAHTLDPTRSIGGVRYLKKSSFLEDVYTFNDFSHNGKTPGCEKKRNVTPDRSRAYLISEYNGHMFPTKPFDSEEHRLEHALRHANVLDAVAKESDIAGSFGWCMFDYNTHRDFGSGDRICYHGVTDMFRNPKLAAAVYASRQKDVPVLEISSSMDIGEHPAGSIGRVFAFTNADELRFYKNDILIRSYTHADSPYRYLSPAPIEIDDFLGERLAENEDFPPEQAALLKDLLNHIARFGTAGFPPAVKAKAALLMTRYHMSLGDAEALYRKYIGDWGGAATSYRFEAVTDGEVVKIVVKAPAAGLSLRVRPSHTVLREGDTWDAALLRISMMDHNGNVLPWWNGRVEIELDGPVALIGPADATLRGGFGGALLRSLGRSGPASATFRAEGAEPVTVDFTVETEE
ncbi:MAG: glycoside hydrolase family 2 protein [Oscillospiraceae bacterium]|nr:glycoside hydrolase family 2 protein [Oscillospiraceae bacterium]